jgi:predicted ATP-dependent endonuclease of OLD family
MAINAPVYLPVKRGIGFSRSESLSHLAEELKEMGENVIYVPVKRMFDLEHGQIQRLYESQRQNPDNLFDKNRVKMLVLDFKGQYKRPIYTAFLQLAYMISLALLAKEKTTMLIEMPEMDLHESFHKTILSDLMSISSIKRIIVTTKSSLIVSANEAVWIN